MNVAKFIENYRAAFGDAAQLPNVFWYSENPVTESEKINGCFFKAMAAVIAGETVSLDANVIGCGGGKFYTGFSDMPPHVPTFVSTKERYKESPEMVSQFLDRLQVPKAKHPFLNITRIDNIDNFEKIEGLFFMATPDQLSGLTTWAYFDNNDDDCVSAIFGSGCSAIFTQAVIENQKNGRRTFLGLFDPSVRAVLPADRLSFTIPMSRFKEMYDTITKSCLFDTHAWSKIKERMN